MSRIISSCSLPSCSCPEAEFTEDVDGNPIVILNDDFGGVVYLQLSEWDTLIKRYLEP